MSRIFLNVAHVRHRSVVNGPGTRSVVWVQGCTLRCPGCFNPHTHPHDARRLFDPKKLGRHLASIPGTNGLTLSGGEPFQQAEACASLAESIRHAGLTVVVFTGYRLDNLRCMTVPAVARFLAGIDLLIAGPYVERLKTNAILWQASANQRLHLLTDRLKDAVVGGPSDKAVVELVTDGRTVDLSGFPDKVDRDWLAKLAAQSAVSPPSTTAKLPAADNPTGEHWMEEERSGGLGFRAPRAIP